MHDQEAPKDMPAHERDPDDAIGGGLMSSGGTAVDRGTGERGAFGTDDDALSSLQDGMVAGPPAGGAQPYVPAVTDDEEDRTLPDV